MRKCKFLSNPIILDETNLINNVEEQHAKFIESFIDNTTYFNGLPIKVVHYNDKNDYGQMLNQGEYRNSSFAHIVSRQPNKNFKARDIDLQRLRTCHWVKELIDISNDLRNNHCENCKGFFNKDLYENGKHVSYLFCSIVRYVIILERHKDINGQEFYIIKTAYYVNEESVYRKLTQKLA